MAVDVEPLKISGLPSHFSMGRCAGAMLDMGGGVLRGLGGRRGGDGSLGGEDCGAMSRCSENAHENSSS